MTGRAKLLLVLAVLAAAGIGALVATRYPADNPVAPAATAAPAPAATPAVTVTRARQTELADTVLVNGTLVAREDVMVGPEIDGYRIAEVLADEGDRVKQGQILARLARDMLDIQMSQNTALLARADAALAQAKSQIVQAEASNAEAQSSLERSRSLAQRGFASQEVLDQRLAAARNAAARLASAHDGLAVAAAERHQTLAQRGEIELRIARTEIRAPIDGIISRRQARIGAIAGMTGDPMFRLIARGEVEFEAEVPEQRLAAIRTGQKVVLEIAGVPPIAGSVRLVPAEVDRLTRLARIRVALPSEAALRVGLFARGVVEIDRRRAISLPLSAIVFDSDRARVQVVRENRISTRPVVLGISTGGRVEIRDGLADGDLVVLRAGAFLRDGDAITPVVEPETAGRS
ncbi:MAG: efflux RND transporter periplasmic adaptor subunit [Alphaproteobacteria bacterium]|nr:efflux RND transporter periplasmic adaptor subunit [Alphaproteobacteria bacterium]